MNLLRQSTAATVNFGPFVDDTDFKTPSTGLSPATSISKNGGAYASGPTGSHQSSGHYSLSLTTSHTDTLGLLRVMSKVTGALSVWRDFTVLPANVYDSLVAGSDKLEVDTVQISSDSTAADNAELMFDGTGYAGGTTKLDVNAVQISGDTTAANNLEALLDGTGGVSLTASEFLLVTPIAANVTQWATSNVANPAVAGVPKVDITHISGSAVSTTSAQIGVNVVQISGDSTSADNLEAFTDGTGYAGGTIKLGVDMVHISGDAGAADNIEAFYDGTGYAANASTIGAVLTAANVLTVSGLAADVITAASISNGAIAELADGVWDESTVGHTSSGTYGQQLQEIRSGTAQGGSSSAITLDASASSSTSFYNDQIVHITSGTGAKQSRKITAYNGSTKSATVNPAWVTAPSSDSGYTIHPSGADTAASLTAAAVADAVWDELRADHVTSGTFGQYVLADMTLISGDATAANSFEAMLDATPGDLTVNAIVLTTPIAANVTTWSGTTVATPTTAGVPEVDITHIAGAAVNTSSAQLGVNVVSMAANTVTASALATDAVDEIWEYATSNIATAGGIGKLITDNLNATVSSRSSHSASDVWAVATRVVTAATNITSTGGTVPITAGGLVSADVTAISTDTTAANNLEAALDGTGGVSITATFAGNLSGNVTGSVGSIAAGGIAAASFAAGAIDATAIATGAIDADAIAADAIGSSELAASAATEIADAILSRNVSNVEGSAAEHTLCTVVLALLEWSVAATTWTINRTDGVTPHATKTLTAAAGDPITSVT
jgi:hypothetical protein